MPKLINTYWRNAFFEYHPANNYEYPTNGSKLLKSFYVSEYDAFVRYFDIAGADDATVRVFISGLSTPSTAGLLDVALHPLLRGRRTLLIDYIGSGFSDKSNTFDHSMPKHADYVAAILDHEGITDCEYVGHSMGGTVGIYLTLNRPDLVSKLVIAEGNLAAGGGPGTRYIASFSEHDYINDIHPKHMENLRRKARAGNQNAMMEAGAWEASDPYGIYRQSRSLVDLPDDFMAQFFSIQIPVTFIYGDANLPENNNGQVFPDSPETETLSAQGVHIGIVENSGHMMMVDNLDGFAQVIADALA